MATKSAIYLLKVAVKSAIYLLKVAVKSAVYLLGVAAFTLGGCQKCNLSV